MKQAVGRRRAGATALKGSPRGGSSCRAVFDRGFRSGRGGAGSALRAPRIVRARELQERCPFPVFFAQIGPVPGLVR